MLKYKSYYLDISGKPMNMTMSGKEKLYFLLDAIIDAKNIAPSGQPLLIDPTNDLNRKYRGIELEQLFTKLENDEKVLRALSSTRFFGHDVCV